MIWRESTKIALTNVGFIKMSIRPDPYCLLLFFVVAPYRIIWSSLVIPEFLLESEYFLRRHPKT